MYRDLKVEYHRPVPPRDPDAPMAPPPATADVDMLDNEPSPVAATSPPRRVIEIIDLDTPTDAAAAGPQPVPAAADDDAERRHAATDAELFAAAAQTDVPVHRKPIGDYPVMGKDLASLMYMNDGRPQDGWMTSDAIDACIHIVAETYAPAPHTDQGAAFLACSSAMFTMIRPALLLDNGAPKQGATSAEDARLYMSAINPMMRRVQDTLALKKHPVVAIPLNVDNAHWVLVVYDGRLDEHDAARAVLYDSMTADNATLGPAAAQLVRTVIESLDDAVYAARKKQDRPRTRLVAAQCVHRQTNTRDCGVYTIFYAERVAWLTALGRPLEDSRIIQHPIMSSDAYRAAFARLLYAGRQSPLQAYRIGVYMQLPRVDTTGRLKWLEQALGGDDIPGPQAMPPLRALIDSAHPDDVSVSVVFGRDLDLGSLRSIDNRPSAPWHVGDPAHLPGTMSSNAVTCYARLVAATHQENVVSNIAAPGQRPAGVSAFVCMRAGELLEKHAPLFLQGERSAMPRAAMPASNTMVMCIPHRTPTKVSGGVSTTPGTVWALVVWVSWGDERNPRGKVLYFEPVIRGSGRTNAAVAATPAPADVAAACRKLIDPRLEDADFVACPAMQLARRADSGVYVCALVDFLAQLASKTADAQALMQAAARPPASGFDPNEDRRRIAWFLARAKYTGNWHSESAVPEAESTAAFHPRINVPADMIRAMGLLQAPRRPNVMPNALSTELRAVRSMPTAGIRIVREGQRACAALDRKALRTGTKLGTGVEGTVYNLDGEWTDPRIDIRAVVLKEFMDTSADYDHPEAMVTVASTEDGGRRVTMGCNGFALNILLSALAADSVGPQFPHLMRVYGACPASASRGSGSRKKPTMFMERVSGSLSDIMDPKTGMATWPPEKDAEALAALAYSVYGTLHMLHSKFRIVHHDLHADNVFYDRITANGHPLRRYSQFLYFGPGGDDDVVLFKGVTVIAKIGDFGMGSCVVPVAGTNGASTVTYIRSDVIKGDYGGVQFDVGRKVKRRGFNNVLMPDVLDWGLWDTKFTPSYDLQYFTCALHNMAKRRGGELWGLTQQLELFAGGENASRYNYPVTLGANMAHYDRASATYMTQGWVSGPTFRPTKLSTRTPRDMMLAPAFQPYRMAGQNLAQDLARTNPGAWAKLSRGEPHGDIFPVLLR